MYVSSRWEACAEICKVCKAIRIANIWTDRNIDGYKQWEVTGLSSKSVDEQSLITSLVISKEFIKCFLIISLSLNIVVNALIIQVIQWRTKFESLIPYYEYDSLQVTAIHYFTKYYCTNRFYCKLHSNVWSIISFPNVKIMFQSR